MMIERFAGTHPATVKKGLNVSRSQGNGGGSSNRTQPIQSQ